MRKIDGQLIHSASDLANFLDCPHLTALDLLALTHPKAAVRRARRQVDKFQGQEAPVLIVSMATSSEETLPRDIGFLFSKNRLNGANSRAQCLAIVVASPELRTVKCNTVEQMALVNLLCRVAEESDCPPASRLLQ